MTSFIKPRIWGYCSKKNNNKILMYLPGHKIKANVKDK